MSLVIVLLGTMLGVLAFVGFRAAAEWERTAADAARGRAAETLAMLNAVLAADMHGAQQSVLRGATADELEPERRFDLVGVVADAFARFPYPEVFFAWDGSGRDASLFSRTARTPDWARDAEPTRAFPVTVTANSDAALRLAAEAIDRVVSGERFAVSHVEVDGRRYQLVARVFPRNGATAVLGFAVDLRWAEENYLPGVVREVAGIGGPASARGVTIDISPSRGAPSEGAPPEAVPAMVGRFPLEFFDSSEIPAGELARLDPPEYIASVEASTDPLLEAANRFARRTRWTILLASAIAVLSLGAGVLSLKKNVQLERMKSEFVARASHELKTPLASMRLVGETLSQGRYRGTETVRDYGRVLLGETARLDRVVGQLLTFSRIADTHEKYRKDEVDVGEAVAEAFARLRHQLDESGFQTTLTRPRDPLKLRGDREALVHSFENVIENAMKYSDGTRLVTATVSSREGRIRIEFEDHGPGIPPDEVERVFDRFFRGREVKTGGAGLGLSIVRRIIEDHGGSVALSSNGQGTRVTISLPEGTA